ncbi:DUF1266 domain-containing protein [Gordonia sp. L191]|uniref:DUF1266 domain-containing protein n=1 Tax=Gordonia sp. L191 TaxID=2982699 RepID=UPI0024C0709F|nr:DUF1266 domain-containing protein [Gordonia sp. L191]WHU46767.1 DUF1266 domain-containing protein [Gordonia sp. L191]
MPCDTLGLDDEHDSIRTRLREWWGITNTTEARQTAGRLLDGMHSATYEVVFPLVSELIKGTDGHTTEAHHAYLSLRALSRNEPSCAWISAHQALHQLRTVAQPFSGYTTPSWPTHIRAWDFARLPFVVRTAHHVGYLDTNESWSILHANLSAARSYYPNWRQFGQGVIIGRTYWRALTDIGDARDYGKEAARAVTALLVRPDSPWRRLPLQPPADTASP